MPCVWLRCLERPYRTMTQTRVVILLAIGLFAVPAPSLADSIAGPFEKPHVRITDPRLRQLVAAGRSASPTFRSLVERLERSNVVVYLQSDVYGTPGVAGRLSFLSVVADTRYVVIRLTPLRSTVQQLAMIGHELQHAVEVAERPGIVDAGSMYREYRRFGYLSDVNGPGVTVETKAALQVGLRVSDELRGAPIVALPALLP